MRGDIDKVIDGWKIKTLKLLPNSRLVEKCNHEFLRSMVSLHSKN